MCRNLTACRRTISTITSRAQTGKFKITTNYPDLFPVMQYAKSGALRRSMWEAWNTRAYPKNRDVLIDMMQTRYQIATLIGYSSWADYNAADKMMENGNNIAKFIADLNTAARPVAEREFAMLLAEKKKTDPTATEIESYESFRLVELVRRSQYDFNSESVRPYLPYPQVKKGVLDTAATLFHVTFRQEPNAPCVGPRGGNMGRDRQRQDDWPVLSRHASPAGQVQSCADVGGYWMGSAANNCRKQS